MASNKSTEPRDTKSYLAEMPTASGEVVKVRLDDPTDEYISTLRQAGVKVTPIQKFTKPRYAKITPEVKHKLVWMIEQGHTYTYACEAECPKEISVSNIARLNRWYLKSSLTSNV